MRRSLYGSNLVEDLATLSNSAVGRVRMIPMRKITFRRGLDALTILKIQACCGLVAVEPRICKIKYCQGRSQDFQEGFLYSRAQNYSATPSN